MPREEIALTFHGAAGTVTGSKHLLEAHGTRILLDAGLFQGEKELRLRNWAEPAFDPRSIDHVVLSHTHIDHVGYLPRLAKLGLRAPVHLTPAAHALAEITLLDSAKIQEEDAEWANRRGFSKHSPALPLYTEKDARAALALRHQERYGAWFSLHPQDRIRARFLNSGHLLGAAFVEVEIERAGGALRLVYSGDLGRFDVPLHLDPRDCPSCDVLIIESTYGDSTHPTEPLFDQIGGAITECLRARGTVLIPAFAIGRAQQVTLILRRWMKAGKIPDVPIHIDSPMAIDATRIYSRFLDKRNVDPDVFEDGRLQLFPERVQFHRTVAESKRLNDMPGPRIVVASSGMLSGGRILHHLALLAPRKDTLLLLAGYQPAGTRGRALLQGAREIKIHGAHIPVAAKVMTVRGLSGHADRDELLRWVGSAPQPPKVAFIVHGELDAAAALSTEIARRFGTRTIRPRLDERFDLRQLV